MTKKSHLFLFLITTFLFACSESDSSVSPVLSQDEYVLWNSSLKNLDVSKARRVVCIGNSITLHKENENVGWKSRHGMAASRRENDYVHRLESMLRENNDSTVVYPANIGEWEITPNKNLDSLLADAVKDADVIVVRLGENMDNEKSVDYYEAAF